MVAGTTSIYSAPADYRIGQQPPSPIADVNASNAIQQLYDAVHIIIQQSSVGGSAGNILSVKASATIAFGMPVNLFNSAGVLTARPASSSLAEPAHGVCSTVDGIASGSSGLITTGVFVATTVAVLVLGTDYWLGSAGALSTTPDTTAGHIEQYIGVAISSNQLLVKTSSWIRH